VAVGTTGTHMTSCKTFPDDQEECTRGQEKRGREFSLSEDQVQVGGIGENLTVLCSSKVRCCIGGARQIV